MDFPGNPARATQVFPDASAGHGQSEDIPENAQHFMVPMCEHENILPAQPTIKLARHIGSI